MFDTLVNFGTSLICVLDIIMEQHALKIVDKCLNTNIYSYSETSGGQSLYLFLKIVHFFKSNVN